MEQNQKNLPSEEKQRSLNDDRRVKVLSPGMLVAKRFFRNRLAMVGLFILIAMFLFSFVGGLISPYGESQVFEGYETMVKKYAGATQNTDYRYHEVTSGSIPTIVRTQFILAIGGNESTFESDGTVYSVNKLGEDLYEIGIATPIIDVPVFGNTYNFPQDVSDEMKAAFTAAVEAGENSFEADGATYYLQSNKKMISICDMEPAGFATKLIVEPSTDASLSYAFKLAALKAMEKGETSFEADGTKYTMDVEGTLALISSGDEEVAHISDYAVQPIENGITLTPAFKAAAIDAIAEDKTSFVMEEPIGENGEIGEAEYFLERKNLQYTIRRETTTKLIKIYEAPSAEHWLGTDANGMDILTRLMYGGRISLLIGFVVIFLETFIGVVLGGVAGYFGGWLDNLIMRLVDIFNCIPTWPILIIIGAILDGQRADATIRIYVMMLILGVLGWPGVARLVRGQILSLREQEFMIAAEATGISVSRRIFKHLIPNVIPQLIVISTMGLGGIILTESTMSFLGLGVKFPYASWGNIISSVSNVYVMTNYWFVWIPAGFLILLTVLGFNFVGDGLRDAFDPKMKR